MPLHAGKAGTLEGKHNADHAFWVRGSAHALIHTMLTQGPAVSGHAYSISGKHAPLHCGFAWLFVCYRAKVTAERSNDWRYANAVTPETVDWREKKAVTPVSCQMHTYAHITRPLRHCAWVPLTSLLQLDAKSNCTPGIVPSCAASSCAHTAAPISKNPYI